MVTGTHSKTNRELKKRVLRNTTHTLELENYDCVWLGHTRTPIRMKWNITAVHNTEPNKRISKRIFWNVFFNIYICIQRERERDWKYLLYLWSWWGFIRWAPGQNFTLSVANCYFLIIPGVGVGGFVVMCVFFVVVVEQWRWDENIDWWISCILHLQEVDPSTRTWRVALNRPIAIECRQSSPPANICTHGEIEREWVGGRMVGHKENGMCTTHTPPPPNETPENTQDTDRPAITTTTTATVWAMTNAWGRRWRWFEKNTRATCLVGYGIEQSFVCFFDGSFFGFVLWKFRKK